MENTEPKRTVKESFKSISAAEAVPVVDKIKQIIAQDGWFGIGEFKKLIEEYEFEPNSLLVRLQEEGIAFVNTSAASPNFTQEVLVDVRYMAAAMLLIYSDRNFAKKHSVLKYLEALYSTSDWEGAFATLKCNPLLSEMYADMGHNFTVMAIAENADLSNQDETYIIERARRNANPMRELVKSDAELTAVFQLALRTMDVVNGIKINGRPGERSDVPFRRFDKPRAYNMFWTAAQKVLDQHFKK